ncbi:3-oxoacyl-[acyl-carrier-protein] synthase III C-terminal domain-containing protein [Paenibacillus tianmuensis]|nr:3-oxoacyl-[acyl-carrier-protein] synthase III C-terminal domain-containing protein [Paenibacillus tianmuensis]
MMQGRFHMDDFSVYRPELTVPMADIISNAVQCGYPLEHDEAYYRERGFETVAVERRLSMEEMAERALEPVAERCRREGIEIGEIWFAHTSQVAWHECNLFKTMLLRWGWEQVPLYPVEEHSCSTFHWFLRMAAYPLARDPDKAVLFVTADLGIHPFYYINEFILSGDSASACLFRWEYGDHQTLAVKYKTAGKVYDNDPSRLRQFHATFYMSIRKMMLETLHEAGFTFSDIRLVVCGNTNRQVWETVASSLRVSPDMFYYATMHEVGHITNTDIPYNIWRALADGALLPGDYYLTVTIGTAGTLGCALHRYVPMNRPGIPAKEEGEL